MKRIIVAILILLGFAFAWQMLAVIKIKAVGQPNSTGPLATQLEQPFFASLQTNTGLPIEIDFKTVDALGIKDAYQLPMMRDGAFDLVSLRLIQNIPNEITLNGLDLIGLSLDFKNARALAYAYFPVVDKRLQERYQVKLLGLWTFGPQQLFCSKPIRNLSDLKGVKVRVASEPLAQFLASLGATPAIIPFEETKIALRDHLVDCAITSASSAASAGWLDNVQYYIPITFNTGINAYAITLAKWNLLNKQQQETLQKAFDKHTDEMWQFSQELYIDQQNCILNKGLCKQKKYDLVKIDPSPADVLYFRDQVKKVSFKEWGEACNAEYPQCAQEWLKLAGPIAGIE